MRAVAGLAGTLLLAACAAGTTERLGLPPLETVDRVDLDRYVGTWYEIASFPQWFQKDCTATTATYTRRSDGLIDVLNACRDGATDGRLRTAHGRARVVASTSAKLEVSFFRPFWGDYWIIELGTDYEYAVVGHPSRDYLWILSRTPSMPDTLYDAILRRLEAVGYDTARLARTVQAATTIPDP